MASSHETAHEKLAVDCVHVVANEGHRLREVVEQMRARGWRASVADADQTLPRGEHPLVVVWLDDDTMLWPPDLEMFCDAVQRERPMACVLLGANRPSRDVARTAIALSAPIAFRDELKLYIDLHYAPVSSPIKATSHSTGDPVVRAQLACRTSPSVSPVSRTDSLTWL